MKIKDLSTYDLDRSYYENFQNGPRSLEGIPSWSPAPSFSFLDFRLNSPLGIPAGLLLNAKWVELYASLGFDVLTYKTVRSRSYPVHPWPNCLFVKVGMMEPRGLPPYVLAPRDWEPPSPKQVTITNSFGMPSLDPKGWQEDVERAKGALREGQLLIVSVAGTFEDTQSKLVEDFVRVAAMAMEAGAPAVELNLSCPNVAGGEGAIYTDAELAGWVVREVKRVLNGVPLFIKVGFLLGEELRELMRSVAPWAEGLVGINSVALPVLDDEGVPPLGPGREVSGVCGWAIRRCGLAFVREATALKEREGYDLVICGCGGVMEPADVSEYMNEGVQVVFTCTGAMFNPYLALEYKGIGGL